MFAWDAPGAGHVQGGIVGTVTDASGAPVPGATVTVKNTNTNFEKSVVTSATGSYAFTDVQIGPYDVKVSLQGFKEFVTTAVPVSVNEVSRVDVQFEVGQLTETVSVASHAELLQTDKADTHTEIRSEAITKLPLQQNRNYQSLINLVPGATPARTQNSEVDAPGRALTTNVNGLNRNNNGTKTDGATNVNIWLPHHTMLVSPAETIDTVNVSTSNFDAEQGMAGGAAITVITKSGTNNFHGSAFEFYNNEKFNAKPYLATEKTPSHAHITGATVGGPIQKDKLFFFGSWEGQYQGTSVQNIFDVPPDALRAGNFSHAFNSDGSLQLIYDPRTGNPDGTGRTPFPGNKVPGIDPIAAQLPGAVPQPQPRQLYRRERWRRGGHPQLRAEYPAPVRATTTTSRSTGTRRRRVRSGASPPGWAQTSWRRRRLLGYTPNQLTGHTTVNQVHRRDDVDADPDDGPRRHVRRVEDDARPAGGDFGLATSA